MNLNFNNTKLIYNFFKFFWSNSEDKLKKDLNLDENKKYQISKGLLTQNVLLL